MEWVLAFKDKPLAWQRISKHPNITMQDIIHHKELPWSWLDINYNPNVTREDVFSNLDIPWDWYGLSQNPKMLIPRECDMAKFVRQWTAASIIKRAWFKCITDASYRMCRVRLLNEFINETENLIALKKKTLREVSENVD